MQKKKLLTC